ncbi:hypothetical protein E3P99_03730 [Wallemia hederae]|uniref:Uncharacterized protein n=1 Tax=Wallemia hederae TaxID=1540922 RepID=A0A4T0FHV3_9BASI|nr:hypothetical protein E3P99_03730 [Wallemia hederae]
MKVAAALTGLVAGSVLAAPISTPLAAEAQHNSHNTHTHSLSHFSLDSDTAAHALFGMRPDSRNEVLRLHRLGHDGEARTVFIKALEEKKAYKVLAELEKESA